MDDDDCDDGTCISIATVLERKPNPKLWSCQEEEEEDQKDVSKEMHVLFGDQIIRYHVHEMLRRYIHSLSISLWVTMLSVMEVIHSVAVIDGKEGE